MINIEQKIQIQSSFVTLGQLLQIVGAIGSGGQAKFFLEEHEVLLNKQREIRRGKKVFPGDVVSINETDQFHIVLDQQED